MAIRIRIPEPLELPRHQRAQYAAAGPAASAAAYATAAADATAAGPAAAYATAAADAYNSKAYWKIRSKYLGSPNPCIQVKYLIRTNILEAKCLKVM